MICARYARRRQNFPRKCAKTPLHAVADDGIANLLGYGDPEPHAGIAIIAFPYEKHESGHGNTLAAVGSKEIGSALDSLQAESDLRPRARRAASTLRPPGVAERDRKP